MTDVRHRDVYRVWYTVNGGTTEYAHFVYAVDQNDATERATRQLSRQMPRVVIEIGLAERR